MLNNLKNKGFNSKSGSIKSVKKRTGEIVATLFQFQKWFD